MDLAISHPLRTGIPCSRSTSDEAQQEPARAQSLPFNEQKSIDTFCVE